MTNVCIHAPVLAGQIETVTGQSDCKDNKSAVVSPGLVSSHTPLYQKHQIFNDFFLKHIQTVMNVLFQEMELHDLYPLTFVIVITKIQI